MSDGIRSVHLTFAADESLMYLIQQTTKAPTEEILGFFLDLGQKIAQIGIDKMEGKGIRKDVRDIYPGTNVPFKILVKGGKRRIWDQGWKFSGYEAHIEVSFPEMILGVDQKALVEKIIERTLLDGESLPNFPQPKNKTPKMYRELIEEVLKGKITSNEKSENKT